MNGGIGPEQGALIQAFLQGQMVGQALAIAAQQQVGGQNPGVHNPGGQQPGGQQPGGQPGAAPQASFLGLCLTPTNYDSVFWCRSRFMCNPQSLSCLC